MVSAVQSPDIKSQRFYLPGLDGLRFFAFLSVFVGHIAVVLGSDRTFPSFIVKLGSSGVDLFFALSAYLITALLMREKERFDRIDIVAFYRRRALRIWPLYFSFLLAVWLLSRSTAIPYITGNYFVMCAIFAGNFAFGSGDPGMVIGPLWSISVEEQFYLTWPWFVRRLSRRGVAAAGIVIWLFAIGFRLWMVRHGVSATGIWYNTLSHLDPMACGVLVWALLDASISRRFSFLLVLAGIILWLVATYNAANNIVAFPIVALGSGAFLMSALSAGEGCWLTEPRINYLGKISYGLYIFHGSMLSLFAHILHPSFLWVMFPLPSLMATIGLAAVSYRWLETPFLRMKGRLQHIPSGSGAAGQLSG
jgi:peptidoglycan/LPS O-acetylase OafA/YrhL